MPFSRKDQQPHPTIVTIAERLGVSTSTVSRVLSGHVNLRGGKSAVRHAAIRALADQLNYRPSFIGQAIREQRTRIVALLNPHRRLLAGNVYGPMLSAAELALREAGYHVMLECVSEIDQLPTDAFLNRRYDGIITFHQITPAILAAVERAAVPTVAINADGVLPRVLVDDAGAMQALVHHCLARGHSRIAFVPGRHVPARHPSDPRSPAYAEHHSLVLREQAFRSACAAGGIASDTLEGFTRDEVVAALLRRPAKNRPTAVIFNGDDLAAACLAALAAHGLHCPADIGVCAFGISDDPQRCTPALTIARVPIAAMAERAVATLLAALEENHSLVIDPPLVLPCPLIVRESVSLLR